MKVSSMMSYKELYFVLMFIEQIFSSPYETVTTGLMLGFLYFGAIDILNQDDSSLWEAPCAL